MNDITVRRPVYWHSYSESNVGTVREINEDSVMSNPESGLWAVADGMGGYEAGNVASNMIAQTLQSVGKQKLLSDFVTSVEDKLLDVNQRILEYAEIMLDGRTLGSTVVSLLIKGQVGICMWVGDSRLYLLRNNELIQLSRDHSRVEELLQQGLITEEEAQNHPDSNVITRAIGIGDELCVDVNVFNVQLGDVFLLCSDGLYNAVNEHEIMNQMGNGTAEQGVSSLIATALQNGASDNVSIIIVKGLREQSGSF
ncbi:MAG: protein phosphatase 2C domain-containing protein [Gammaproteobacteria bacterium]|nr:protein phosphatase 2C domain-containing protein [Gammaproteobacteria bacterium]MDH5652773.1 protein phosphatase 2C domain-containing protein [Gammaproteobacteria bacterium]